MPDQELTLREKQARLVLALCLAARPVLQGRVEVILKPARDGRLWRATKRGEDSGVVRLHWHCGINRRDLRAIAARAALGCERVALRETNADALQENAFSTHYAEEVAE